MKLNIKSTAVFILIGVIASNIGFASETRKGAAGLVSHEQRPTVREQRWLKASPEERIALAEQLGENGAMRLARSKGWTPLLDAGNKTVPQGPDLIYRGANGTVHVIEAKGGGSALGNAYGYKQGTAEWAVKSAERIANMRTATEVERHAAREVLEAARLGKIEVHVFRTRHVLGEPKNVVIETTMRCTGDASKLARNALARPSLIDDRVVDKLVPGCTTGEADGVAGGLVAIGEGMRTVAKGATVVGLLVDGGLRTANAIETEQEYRAGQISYSERNVSHARNAAGMLGGWAGATGGADLGAEGGAVLGTAILPGAGTVIGGVLGGIAGGVSGYLGGEFLGNAAVTELW